MEFNLYWQEGEFTLKMHFKETRFVRKHNYMIDPDYLYHCSQLNYIIININVINFVKQHN